MARAATFPSKLARERRIELLRKHWRALLIGVATVIGITAAMFRVLPDVTVPLWAVVPAAVVLVVAFGYPMIDGTYHLWAAHNAEVWTNSDLRKLERDGWAAVGPVPFDGYDVDHVLVGPSGVYAIDTKYTDSDVNFGDRRSRGIVQGWADKAYDASRSLRLLLHHNYGVSVEVSPMVVAWGPQVTGRPVLSDGVAVLHGSDLPQELARRGSQRVLSGDRQRDVVAAVEDFIRIRAEYERSTRGSA
jgi:hypothetical protein